MLRASASVIVGCIAMFVLIVLTISAVQLALGDERVFKPGSYDVPTTIMVLGLVLRAGAAVVGGLVCRAIARSARAPMALVGLVLVLGVVGAVMNRTKADPGPRVGAVTPWEAAAKVRRPDWYAFALPLIEAVGVMGGARCSRRKG
jgi:hypothetical protein